MRFNSLTYLAFLGAVAIALQLLPQRARRWWLLATSWAFYATWHYPYLALLVLVSTLNYFGARWVASAPQRDRRGAVVIAGNLVVLGAFKYSSWAVENTNWVARWLGVPDLPVPEWLLPLGISFYVFECISYVVDVVRRREPIHAFWDFQLYVAFFPHLVAGPIVRAKELIPQLSGPLRPSASQLRSAAWLISSGLFLKVVVADGLSPSVDAAFDRDPASLSWLDVWTMAAGFGMQIYLDFSSYTRIALGSAQLCGIELVPNFRFPYVAQSPVDFWNRWHMSLSRWIRDYLFYPLLRGKNDRAALSRAAVLSMTICGVWHGASWSFVLWGLYHGILIATYHLTARRAPVRVTPASANALAARAKAAASVGGTFALVSLGWILFRARDVSQAGELFTIIVTPWRHLHRTLPGTFYLHTALLVACAWAAPFVSDAAARWARAFEDRVTTRLLWASGEGIVVGVFLVLTSVYLRNQSAFIYFQF